MRKIRKVIADSTITYYDRNGAEQTFHTNGNVRTNVLVDDITVNKNTYVMDVDTYIEHAERVTTDVNGTDTDNDNDKDIEF